MNDTIAAISTPMGVGAIGVVRISGPLARDCLKRLWISNQVPVEKMETHRFYYGKLSTERETIDEALVVLMASPNSYTGEDVIEIHCHGGSLVTKKVLEALLNTGARAAEPGEFTRRAFMNGKLDLAQAEGVADVINAASARALKIAEEQLAGRLSHEIQLAQDELKNIKAFVEATIDFPEEDVDFIENDEIGKKISIVREKLEKLASTYSEGRYYHDGVRVVIVGRPNVGKSSLLNALIGTNRAIVHYSPGTTRDIIEEDVQIGGVLFRLIDTAGIRDSVCEIENEGVRRARMKIEEADLAIVVLDASEGMTPEDEVVLGETKDTSRIIVWNKMDMMVNILGDWRSSEHPAKAGRAGDRRIGPKIFASAATGKGLGDLKSQLIAFVHGQYGESEGVIVTNLRHKRALDEGIVALSDTSAAIFARESSEFIAEYLQCAMKALGRIIGEVTTDDVLNEIFGKFCIGK